jgi:hypothetical protein
MRCNRWISEIERMVVPPSLRTRSARSSVVSIFGLLVEQKMITAEMWTADMPMEILRVHRCGQAGDSALGKSW